jgi:hypothetical protein
MTSPADDQRRVFASDGVANGTRITNPARRVFR